MPHKKITKMVVVKIKQLKFYVPPPLKLMTFQPYPMVTTMYPHFDSHQRKNIDVSYCFLVGMSAKTRWILVVDCILIVIDDYIL